MKFQELITRAFRIAFANKFLWFFGFFIAFEDFGANKDHLDIKFDRFYWDWPFDMNTPLAILLIIAGVLFILTLVFFGIVAVGALISSVQRIDDGEKLSFSDAFYEALVLFTFLFCISLDDGVYSGLCLPFQDYFPI